MTNKNKKDRSLPELVDIRTWCVTIAEASSKYIELQKYLNSQGKLDFGDPNALRTYNKAIAKIMFDLNIDVPENNLIPTICLRYAYVKIIIEKFDPDRILEIGTGASAILALIAAKEYNRNVTATEIDDTSLEWALKNIEKNKLSKLITLIKSQGGILQDVINTSEKFDVLISYPPVYPTEDTKEYLMENRKERGFLGSISEMIGGGSSGFEFTEQMIKEVLSPEYKNNFKVFSILCIMQEHAIKVQELLSQLNCNQVDMIELKAGNRLRYIVFAKLKY